MKRLFIALSVAASTFAASAFAAVEIQEVESPGGFKAWLVEEPSIPFVALELRFRGGTALDEPGKRGATSLMVSTLEEGAADMDASAFAAAKEGIAAKIRFDAGDDAVAISMSFLSETRDEAVELLRAALVEPRFDSQAVERVRAQLLSNLQSDLKDPDTIAGRAFDAMVFGDHPYGTPPDGTLESVAALTRADLVTALKNALVQDRAYVAAAGDISAEELGAVMDRLLSDLPESGAPLPDDVDVTTEAGVSVVPFDTPQSVAVFGHKGMKRDDPDFFAAFLLNTIFGGGGFESRLMTEVREKRGLTYGIYTYLAPKDHAELFVGRVASANDRIAEAIAVIRDEWARIAEEGVTAEELERAKTYQTGAYPLRFDGNEPIAKILVGMQMDDLTPEYIETRNAKIEAVTQEDIARVARELLKPEALHFTVVGQPEGLDTPGQ
jgi:zinc protease